MGAERGKVWLVSLSYKGDSRCVEYSCFRVVWYFIVILFGLIMVKFWGLDWMIDVLVGVRVDDYRGRVDVLFVILVLYK